MMLGFKVWICLLLLLKVCSADETPLRPLVMIHALTSSYEKFDTLAERVHKDYPDMETFSLDAFNNLESFESLDKQVEVFGEMVQNITDEYGDITLLGYSQGGVVSRAIIEMYGNPHIHTFIALASPLAGEYGEDEDHVLQPTWFPNIPFEKIWEVCYNPLGQLISVCNYWKDPKHQILYKLTDHFLPELDNQVKHDSSEQYKENFEQLRGLKLIGGPDDNVVSPWQSSQFGFYDKDLDVVLMKHQEYFKENWFGLKTLSDEGRISKCTVLGVHHLKFAVNEEVYEKCIKDSLL